MEIAIICVNYNSYQSLSQYLLSIEKAVKYGGNNIKVSVFIADNSNCKEELNTFYKGNLLINVFLFENLGYFGGALAVYNNIEKENYDYIIISNVDLSLNEKFFQNLFMMRVQNNIGWLAPSIITKLDKHDMNPKIVNRYSKRTMMLLRFMNKYPIVRKIYIRTLHKAQYSLPQTDKTEREIYAGHGAMFILTNSFVKAYPSLEYPVFLYGEEIFVGEMVRLSGLKTLYVPNLIVYDDAHVSTRTIKKKDNNNYHVEALTYLIDKFYE